MAFVRRNVWELGGDWAEPILWYARGVKAMRARALADPVGWRFYGAIHGIDQDLWRQLGYLTNGDRMPSAADQRIYWNQCQHGSWYFEPWHRGYLIALETIIRDAIKDLPNAPADWALSYWNYFKPGQAALPPAFASPNWPDGNGDNPLFVSQRYGPNNDDNVFVPVDQIDENALGDPDFIGAANGGSPGFGGPRTRFSHGGSVHGGIETQPHDWVHGLVGGSDPETNLPGLMSDPDTAGLDPIFWLHHANIDRLWQVWRTNPASHQDPPDADWKDGPAATGGRRFVLPLPGGTSWTYTPAQMSDFASLSYTYDDTSAPAAVPQAVARLELLGAATAARTAPMATPRNVELLGANTQSLRVVGADTRTSVALDQSVREKVANSLRAVATAQPAAPDRVFLNLENVRGKNDATAFRVYVGLADNEDPATHPEKLAGKIALFGVRKASLPNDEHAGNGLTFVLEITHLIDAMHLAGSLNTPNISVRLVPTHPVPEAAEVSIGRVSVFRQGR